MVKGGNMFSKERTLSGAIALTVILYLFGTMAFADPAQNPPANSTTNTASNQPAGSVTAQPQQESPPPTDTRAMTPEEMEKYQTQAQQTAQNTQVQQMNVGMTVNGTIVLSVLLALVIFAVLVAVL